MLNATHEEAQQTRRGQRIKTLTEKDMKKEKEVQEGKIKGLQQKFNYIYDKWKTHVKSAKQSLSQTAEP